MHELQTRRSKYSVEPHHVCSVDRRGHFDLPEVLSLRELLGAADSRCAAAVLRVEAHLPVLAAQQRGR